MSKKRLLTACDERIRNDSQNRRTFNFRRILLFYLYPLLLTIRRFQTLCIFFFFSTASPPLAAGDAARYWNETEIMKKNYTETPVCTLRVSQKSAWDDTLQFFRTAVSLSRVETLWTLKKMSPVSFFKNRALLLTKVKFKNVLYGISLVPDVIARVISSTHVIHRVPAINSVCFV